jgi:hypothetical protein
MRLMVDESENVRRLASGANVAIKRVMRADMERDDGDCIWWDVND